MRLTIVAVGRLRLGAERDSAARYLKQAGQLASRLGLRISIREIAESRRPRLKDRREGDAVGLLAAVPARAMVCVLDQSGVILTSEAFSNQVRKWRDDTVPDLAFIIGGADGLSSSIIDRAHLTLAFGQMTWPHQLVRVMLLEQLYRAMTIMIGHPYHRA